MIEELFWGNWLGLPLVLAGYLAIVLPGIFAVDVLVALERWLTKLFTKGNQV